MLYHLISEVCVHKNDHQVKEPESDHPLGEECSRSMMCASPSNPASPGKHLNTGKCRSKKSLERKAILCSLRAGAPNYPFTHLGPQCLAQVWVRRGC